MFKRGFVFIFILFLFPLLFAACSTNGELGFGDTVFENSDPNVVISGISLPGNYIELTKSKDAVLYYDISAVAEPSNAVNKKLLYSSSNPDIASVDEKGVLAIKDFGEFSVKVQSESNAGIWQQIDFYVAETILTPVDIDNIPLSIFGNYAVSQYGINKTPDTNISGSFSINANKSNAKVVDLGFVFNGAAFDLTLPNSDFSSLSYEEIALQIKEQLKVTKSANSDADIIISLSSTDFPQFTESELIGEGDVLQLSLKKLNDINVGQDVESMPVTTTSVSLASNKEVDRKNEVEFLLEPTIKPSNATDKSVLYSSSDEKIATVNEIGLVTLHKAGNVQIKAVSSSNDKASGVMNVVVTDSTVPVTGIVRKSDINNVTVGKTIDLSGNAVPEDATHKTITYISVNPEIASIDSTTGIVTGIKKGSATIFAITDGGNYKEEYTVTVDAFAFPVTAIMNMPSKLNISISDEAYPINPQAFPEYAYDKNLTYTVTSGSDIISFDETTKTIKGLKEGTGVLTVASASDASVNKSMTVNVRANSVAVEVSEINLNNPPANLYLNYTTFNLKATVNADANVNTKLAIETSNPSVIGAYAVANTENQWELTPVAEGTSEVKVYSESGVEKKFTVTVHKVMNTKGYYRVSKVDYSYNGVNRTFYPTDSTHNDNLQGEFALNVENNKLLFNGRLQLRPNNTLDKTSYTFNNWRFLYVNKEIALDSNDSYAKQTKTGYTNLGFNITSEKTMNYLYTDNGFQARIYLEKISDVYEAVEDKTIYVTPIDLKYDPQSVEGYYEMTWFYGNPFNQSSTGYQPKFSHSASDRPTASDLGISYLSNGRKCMLGIICMGGTGDGGSVANYTGAFSVKVDGTNANAQLSSTMKVQMNGHEDVDVAWQQYLRYIHGTFDPITLSQNTINNTKIINKSLKVSLISGSGSEGSKGAYIAYTQLDSNNMQFEMQFLSSYQFMYRAVKVSDRYIDLPTAKYVDGDISGRTPPERPAQAYVEPLRDVVAGATDIY